MRGRVVLGLLAAFLAVGLVVVFWPRHGDSVVAAPTTTTTTVASTTTTTQPAHAFEAADAVVPEVKLYDAPNGPDTGDSLPNPTVEHVPLAFLVKEHGPPGWLKVQISRRPNGSTAWIHESDVTLRPVDNRIVIQRDERILTLYKGNTDQVLFQAPVGVGTAATPTPLGDFFIDVVVQLTHPGGVYGPFQLSVAGFSDVLQSFGGGPGQIAIHGTNHPELIGGFISNGCVRMTNEDITTLQPMAPVGTPVQVIP